jgi:hypothetical protein
VFRKFFSIVLIAGAVLALVFLFLPVNAAVAIYSGYMLSSIFSVSGLFVIDRFFDAEQPLFVKAFFFSLFIRFFLVLGVLALLLAVTKIDEIYFTVSFLISYLCQSVTEMVFFNISLQRHSNQKQ